MAEVTLFINVDAASANALLMRLERTMSQSLLATFMGTSVVPYLQEKFQGFFDQEGADSGPWLPLAEMTIQDRVSQGFGEGPINVRTGALRQLVTGSPGVFRFVGAGTAVMSYPGRTPKGELGRKLKTAQQGGAFAGHSVPARPVMEVGPEDQLFLLSALSFFVEKRVG